MREAPLAQSGDAGENRMARFLRNVPLCHAEMWFDWDIQLA